jgi:hypothetical protein
VSLLAGMQSGPRNASASLCVLTNVAADRRSDDCATLHAAVLLTRLQVNLDVTQATVLPAGESRSSFLHSAEVADRPRILSRVRVQDVVVSTRSTVS